MLYKTNFWAHIVEGSCIGVIQVIAETKNKNMLLYCVRTHRHLVWGGLVTVSLDFVILEPSAHTVLFFFVNDFQWNFAHKYIVILYNNPV